VILAVEAAPEFGGLDWAGAPLEAGPAARPGRVTLRRRAQFRRQLAWVSAATAEPEKVEPSRQAAEPALREVGAPLHLESALA
jgi:hypothetical protein